MNADSVAAGEEQEDPEADSRAAPFFYCYDNQQQSISVRKERSSHG